jgi:BTB/POZ domain
MSVDLNSLVEPDVATVEGRTKEVEIEDIEPSVLKEMLRYLYTGRAPNLDEDDMTEPLFLAADKYQIGTRRLKGVFYRCICEMLA